MSGRAASTSGGQSTRPNSTRGRAVRGRRPALATSSQLTAQAVAENFGVGVAVDGDLDLRGTMGIDEDVPVGFEDIRLNVTVSGDVDEGTKEAIQTYTEKYCVVYQTLEHPPGVETDWTFE